MIDTNVSDAWDGAAARYTELLGYAPGQRLSTPEAVAGAICAITAARPERCALEEIGRTYEGRPLQLLTIGTPDHIANLEAIRQSNLALADPASGASAPPTDHPATAWVIANVHGDEHSTAEAALMLACYLSESDDPLLKNVIVGIDPIQNPDGRARSVNAYYSLFGLKPRKDSYAAEHWEPWGGGRGNHYLFDLNRDWFPLTQPESRARVAAFLRWRPQVLADAHEMWWDSRYFFPPPAKPLNPNLAEHIRRWWEFLGRDIAATFDANGWDYWTGEVFDAFYPGYGEAFPTMHGCAGMTFEQASAAGIEVERKDGTLLRFEDAIRHHFGSTLSVCRTAADRREQLLSDVRTFFTTAPDACADGPRAFLFPDAGPGQPAERLADILTAQGITVERMTEETNIPIAPYEGGDETERTVPEGALVVRLDQPEGRAARSVLERETPIDPDWLAEQVRRRGENVEAEFYDHTAWSLPLALGVETLTTTATGLPLAPWKPALTPREGPRPAYGFLIPVTGTGALAAACRLMGRGVRVHVARRDFTLDGTPYGRGTLIVKKPDQPSPWEYVCEEVWAAVHESGAALVLADTAWTEEGISLGSDDVVYVKPPRIAVLYGAPVSSLSYGWIAYLFEQRLDLDFTPIRAETLSEADLRRYDVIVLPNGKADAYASGLSEGIWKALQTWMEQGGTLIALGGASSHIAGKGKDWTSSRVVKDIREPAKPEPGKAEPAKAEPAAPESEKTAEKDGNKDEPVPPEFRPEHVIGAALRVKLDRHHWATLGFGEESHVPFASDLLLAPTLDGRNVAAFLPEGRLTLAGFVWERMRKALPGKSYIVGENHGRGHLVLFAGDPNQRGYWDISSHLFVNAVLFKDAA